MKIEDLANTMKQQIEEAVRSSLEKELRELENEFAYRINGIIKQQVRNTLDSVKVLIKAVPTNSINDKFVIEISYDPNIKK